MGHVMGHVLDQKSYPGLSASATTAVIVRASGRSSTPQPIGGALPRSTRWREYWIARFRGQ